MSDDARSLAALRQGQLAWGLALDTGSSGTAGCTSRSLYLSDSTGNDSGNTTDLALGQPPGSGYAHPEDTKCRLFAQELGSAQSGAVPVAKAPNNSATGGNASNRQGIGSYPLPAA